MIDTTLQFEQLVYDLKFKHEKETEYYDMLHSTNAAWKTYM